MALTNPNIAGGDGFTTGSQASSNSIAVTGAFDFAWTRINTDPFIGGGGSTQGITLTAAGNGTVNNPDLFNKQGMGFKLFINITSITAGSLTVSVQGKDPVTGTYYTIISSVALTTTGFTVLTVFPGAPVVANVSANDHLPLTFRIQTVVATGPVTATIGMSELV